MGDCPSILHPPWAKGPMLAKRIIPCLDVKDGRVVKGVRFVSLRDAGDPVEVARRYDEEEADELTFLDTPASHEKRDILIDVVRRTAEQVFMPLTVGGGVRTLDDIRNLLSAGADKGSINTAAGAPPDGDRCRGLVGTDGGVRGGGDPAHQHGPRRNARRVRHPADPGHRGPGGDPRDRLGRRRGARPPVRGAHGGRGGRGSRGVHLPLPGIHRGGGEGISAPARRSGTPRVPAGPPSRRATGAGWAGTPGRDGARGGGGDDGGGG